MDCIGSSYFLNFEMMKKSNYNIIGKPHGGKQITKTANLSSVAEKESDPSIQSSEVSVIRTKLKPWMNLE